MPTKARTKTGGARLAPGGPNLYVGTRDTVPSGYARFATRNEAYRAGRRLGYAAGILKGRELTKSEILANPNKFTKMTLSAIARHLRYRDYQSSNKAQLLAWLGAHNWKSVDLRKLL